VGERRGQGEEWSELGRVGALPGSSRTRGWGSGLGALWLGKRGGGEGTEEMLSGWQGLASGERGSGQVLVRVCEDER
jgi:hypothetical protein